MEQYYEPIKNYFDQKVYLILHGRSGKLLTICKTEEEATNYIKFEIDESHFNYRDIDIKAIEEGEDSKFYNESVKDAIDYAKNYKILIVFGVDITKKIYKIITKNDDIYDNNLIITNDVEIWKQYFKRDDEPNFFYYFDYQEEIKNSYYLERISGKFIF